MLNLTTLGWDDDFAEQFEQHRAAGLVPGRVAVQHRGQWDVLTEDAELRCEIPGKMFREAAEGELPAVGDWVAVEPLAESRGLIHAVLPRRTKFSRLAAAATGSEMTREQVVAANVDVVFIVTSLNEDLNPRRIERYLTLAWESGAQPVILLTKSDLVDDPVPLRAEVELVSGGVPVHAISARSGEGVEIVRETLGDGRTGRVAGLVRRREVDARQRARRRGAAGDERDPLPTAAADTRPRGASSSRSRAAVCCSTRPGCAS